MLLKGREDSEWIPEELTIVVAVQDKYFYYGDLWLTTERMMESGG